MAYLQGAFGERIEGDPDTESSHQGDGKSCHRVYYLPQTLYSFGTTQVHSPVVNVACHFSDFDIVKYPIVQIQNRSEGQASNWSERQDCLGWCRQDGGARLVVELGVDTKRNHFDYEQR